MGLDRFIAIAFPHLYVLDLIFITVSEILFITLLERNFSYRWIQQHYIKSLIIYSLFPIGYTAWIVGIAARTKTETQVLFPIFTTLKNQYLFL